MITLILRLCNWVKLNYIEAKFTQWNWIKQLCRWNVMIWKKDGIEPMQVSERQVQTRSPTRCCPMIGWKCWSVIEGYEWRHFSYKNATQNSVVQLELTLQVINIWSLGQRGNDSGINFLHKWDHAAFLLCPSWTNSRPEAIEEKAFPVPATINNYAHTATSHSLLSKQTTDSCKLRIIATASVIFFNVV